MKIWSVAASLLLAGTVFAEPAPQKVTFVTEDGITLAGTLIQQGPNYVILSYQWHASQYVWQDFASELVDQGYSVLMYDYRGVGDSGGTFDPDQATKDVTAAYQFLQSRGVQSVVMIGASMGASSTYKAALRVKGAVLVSPGFVFDKAALRGPQGPLLFITSTYDSARQSGEEIFAASSEPKQLFISRGQAHGNAIIDGNDERVRPLIYEFLKKCFR